MVCYKNGVEDPLAGVEDDRVGAIWGAWPVDRPENTTTGVSLRHGAAPGIMEEQYQLVTPHPFFANTSAQVQGDLFGWAGGETDGWHPALMTSDDVD